MKIGLTGGLASGKSFVGRTLESFGAHLIRADELGHQSLAPDGEAYQPVIDAFGSEILDANRGIDRRRLAALVFADPKRLEQLNAIVHPAVHRLQDVLEAQFRAIDPHGIIVVEAAILIETGTWRNYQRIILVTCTEEQQIERAMSRDGMTREEVLARLSRQLPLQEKRQYADFIIDTSGTKEDTERQTRAVYEALKSLA